MPAYRFNHHTFSVIISNARSQSDAISKGKMLMDKRNYKNPDECKSGCSCSKHFAYKLSDY